jgi:hypothetical protein
MWKRSLLQQVGYLDPRWHLLLDREYFFRMFRFCNPLYIPGPVAFFRNQPESKSMNESDRWIAELEALHQEIFDKNSYSLDPYLLRYKNRNLASVYLMNRKIAIENGQKKSAREFSGKAWKTDPVTFLNARLIIPQVIRFRKFQKALTTIGKS